MSQYVTYTEFLNSPYGSDYEPGGSIFNDYTEVDEFLAFISSLIDLYCSRSFGPGTFTDTIDGTDEKVIFLSVIPATGIVSVDWRTVGGGATGTIAPNQYTLYPKTGKVKFLGKLDSDKIYDITYDAGYDVVPEPIKQATLMLANAYAQGIDNGAVAFAEGGANVQFRFAKFQEQYADPRHKNPQYNEGIPVTVEAILRRYRYFK